MSAPSLAQKVSNIKHMPVLLAATSATKDAPDGYMVKDIVKMTYESQQTRMFLQQYLTNQLITTNNVYSKIKILRILIVLMEEGHIEFKQNLRRTPEPFNEAAKLRPNQPKDQKLVSECGRIRDMANKLLDMMYTEVPELRKSSTLLQSSSTSMSESSSSNAGSRITGFGNTGSGNTGSTTKQSTTDKLKSLFGTSGKSNAVIYDPSYATMDPVPHNVTSHSSSNNWYKESVVKPTGVSHERGHVGGGWDNQETGQTGYKPVVSQWSSQKYSEEQESQNDHVSSSTSKDYHHQHHHQQQHEEAGIEQEQMLVDEITAPGGVRAAPPRESLTRFVSRCKVLDTLLIVDCLRLKLSSGESQTVLRALFVIEFLLRSDIPDILSHLDIVLQDLSELTSSPNSSIKAKANKILVQLMSANDQRTAAPARSTANQQLTSSGDDEQVEDEEEEEEEADNGVEATENSGISSIFSGLSVSGEKTQRPHPPKQAKKIPKRSTPTTTTTTTTTTRSNKSTSSKKGEEDKSAFGDILGLGDLSSNIDPKSMDEQQPSSLPSGSHDVVVLETATIEPPGEQQEDDSLLTFEEEDVEFDPLIRSDSFSQSGFSKSGSFSSGSKNTRVSHVESVSSSSVAPPLMGSPVINSRPPPPPPLAPSVPSPMTSQDSMGLLDDLSGINLDSSSSSSLVPPHTLPQRQDSLSVLLQTASSGAVAPAMNVMVTSSAGIGMTPYPQGIIQIVPGSSGLVGQGIQGGVAYGGGGTPGMVPVMYASQVTPGVMYQPQLGGTARPVQRAPVSKEQTPPPDTGFSFLGKSNKSTAFDFVQEEMEATKTKK